MLPKITNGTIKQIVYAEKIRSIWIKKLNNWIVELEIKLNQNNLNNTTQTIYETKLQDYKILLSQYQTRNDTLWFIRWKNGIYQG